MNQSIRHPLTQAAARVTWIAGLQAFPSSSCLRHPHCRVAAPLFNFFSCHPPARSPETRSAKTEPSVNWSALFFALVFTSVFILLSIITSRLASSKHLSDRRFFIEILPQLQRRSQTTGTTPSYHVTRLSQTKRSLDCSCIRQSSTPPKPKPNKSWTYFRPRENTVIIPGHRMVDRPSRLPHDDTAHVRRNKPMVIPRMSGHPQNTSTGIFFVPL